MDAISYITGDEQITDFPECSARPLAAFVQWCNDLLAGPDGYLSPEDSILALDLGWQTVGTANAFDTVIHAWLAELLTSPCWGIVWYAKDAAAKAISDIAELHRMAASGDMPPAPIWYAAHCAGHTAARVISQTSDRRGLYAVRAAYESTAIVDTEDWAKVDAVTGNALHSHALAPGAIPAGRAVGLTRHAVDSWRYLAGLDIGDSRADISPDRVHARPLSIAAVEIQHELVP